MYPLTSFLRLARTGTSTSDSSDSHELSVKEGILESLPSSQRGKIKQYNVFKLLCEKFYDKKLCFLTYSRSWEVAWNHCKLSRSLYDLEAG